MAEYKGNKTLSDYPDEVIPADKKMVDSEVVEMSDDEYTTRVDESIDNHIEAQKPVPPSPSDAKSKLLDMAENDWNLDMGQIRTLRRKHALLFDFIEEKNYDKAKQEVSYVVSEETFLDSNHEQDVHDLLDGKLV